MSYPYYEKQKKTPLAEVPADLTLRRGERQNSPEGYIADSNLVDAVNVALMLGQPLLLTGEPGTGKTHLAHSVSWQLGFKTPSPFVFETKSTSTARDLFYTYDAIGRFQSSQTGSSSDPRTYITYNALGMAILLANPKDKAKTFFAESEMNELEIFLSAQEDNWQRRSVVLIDEIDKAPRDFPNDILNEIQEMYFRVPELGNKSIKVPDDGLRPVIILTSNSEKNLPDAFLRRCVYYHIEFPGFDNLKKIAEERLKDNIAANGKLGDKQLEEAIKLFYLLRAGELTKKPATAELLGWLTAIRKLCDYHKIFQDSLKDTLCAKNVIEPTLGVLIKNADDFALAKSIVEEWLQTK
jgi:MoxR-like ATPase